VPFKDPNYDVVMKKDGTCFIIVGLRLVWLERTGDAEVNSGYDCPRAESKRNPQYDREPYSEGVSKKKKKFC
jgi:hypothetical protein